MRPLAPRFLVAIAACVIAFACGSVPTFGDDIAFISALDIPSLAVAVNDTLRDSLGRVAPLRVHEFDLNEDTIAGVKPSFLVITLPAGVTIDANGIVTAGDSIRRVQIVGRVGEHLQTVPANLEVVAQPDQMSANGTIAPLAEATPSSPLQVSITGNQKNMRVPVSGIIVRYSIVRTFPSVLITDSVFAFTEGKRGSDLTKSVDTTEAGATSRSIVAAHLTGIDSIIVEATAKDLKGVPLPTVRFLIPVKKAS
jgi:hypothetical protein